MRALAFLPCLLGCGSAAEPDEAPGTGADELACGAPAARYASEVVAVQYGPGQAFGRDRMPAVVLGPPHGAGCCAGSLDVVSLGNGGAITVGFGPSAIADGPGPDFIVFENAFYVGGDPDAPFAELATVEVSADGTTWTAFPCTATAPPYGTCAGWHPVYQDGDGSPLEPEAAGGDAFDLATVGLPLVRYVRMTDRADLDGPQGVFDLDAVGIVNPVCP
ncbi:MAG: hypothetical protein HY744_26765 [Deltaproteobacteria bacterium]|nr:hypothetical protein [Deltaproteobacteria bacterium]